MYGAGGFLLGIIILYLLIRPKLNEHIKDVYEAEVKEQELRHFIEDLSNEKYDLDHQI